MLQNKKLPKFITQFTIDSFWVSLGFGINALSALIISILLTRILDAESMGVYFLAFSLIMIFSMASQLGLNTTVVRIISSATLEEKRSFLNKTIIKMLLVIASISALMMLFFMSDYVGLLLDLFSSMNLISSSMYIIGLLILIIAIRTFIAEVFRGFGDIKRASLYQRILPNILMLSMLFLIVASNYKTDLHIVLNILLLANFILCMIIFVPFKNKLNKLSGNDSLAIGTLLSSSSPIAASQICQLIFTQIPLWVLGATSLPEDIANYGVAFRLAALVSLPLLIANNVIMPHVAKQHATNNKHDLNALIQITVIITSLVSLLFLVVFAFFGDKVLALLFGEEYVIAYLILLVIGCGQAVNVFSGSPAVILAMAGKETYVLYSNLFASIIVLVASVIIIPIYGAVGAAVVTAIGLIVVNIFLSYYSYKIIGYKTYISVASIKSAKYRLLG
ncbi:MAG: oligosaccharide flippase family protein [Candidatus Polarisedimenticolaceae bacterium]|nr:oligosaccharide flippase family protein [Candidatus Polarisedimenticolaceae bacterium]